MYMPLRFGVGVIFLAFAATPGAAQRPTLAFGRPSAGIVVARNLQYGSDGGASLHMDVYRPPGGVPAQQPGLIFFNRASGRDRGQALYEGWARAAASGHVVGIVPDLREGHEAEDFQRLLGYLTMHGVGLGLDTTAITVYAASGNVATALPILENPRAGVIKAAVVYYGAAAIDSFRLDLPLLVVRAGLDRPEMNRDLASLAAAAIAQNAPVTLVNHPTGYHGFELFNDDDATRAVIEQTLAFVRQVTSRRYRAALDRRLVEAAAAGAMQTGDYTKAVRHYRKLVEEQPDDARLRLSFGEALLADGQFAASCADLETLKNRGLGARDVGVPAARACALAGNADAAMAWLKSIPSRFLPADLVSDPAFAAIRDRPDFRTLFGPP